MVRLSRNESTDSCSSSNTTIPDNVIQKEARITRNATAPLRPLDPNQMFILSGMYVIVYCLDYPAHSIAQFFKI